MTSDELRKAMTEKISSQITIEGKVLTGGKKYIWCNGYYTGVKYGLKYSIARTKEMFDDTYRVKREEEEKRIIEITLSQITIGDRKLTDKEIAIWHEGYYAGTVDALKYSVARTKEMFDPILHKKEKKINESTNVY